MGEGGAEGALWHRRVGGLLAGTGLDLALLRGRFAGDVAAGAVEKGMSPKSLLILETNREIVDRLCPQIGANDWILVKGSRGMKMEEVVEGLLGAAGCKARSGAKPEGGTP
jgi:UDP-N-acetylmuramyl pentapeptide synthase